MALGPSFCSFSIHTISKEGNWSCVWATYKIWILIFQYWLMPFWEMQIFQKGLYLGTPDANRILHFLKRKCIQSNMVLIPWNGAVVYPNFKISIPNKLYDFNSCCGLSGNQGISQKVEFFSRCFCVSLYQCLPQRKEGRASTSSCSNLGAHMLQMSKAAPKPKEQ